MLGIVLQEYLGIGHGYLFSCAVSLVIIFLVLFLTKRLGPLRWLVILALCVLVGALRLNIYYDTSANHIKNLKGEFLPMRLVGTVVSELKVYQSEKYYQQRSNFIVKLNRLNWRGESDVVSGLVKVNCRYFTPQVDYGDQVELLGLLYTPYPPTNPGQFHYARYLARRNIYKMFKVSKPEDIKVISRGKGNPLRQITYGVRQSLSKRVDERFRADQAGLLKALLLGKREAVSDDLEDKFVRSGTIHYLAVSGLHVGIIVFIFFWLLWYLGIRGRLRVVLLIFITILYAGLTGFNIPVVRASIMVITFFGAELFNRKRVSLNTLALAALIILGYNPAELFRVGFQFSFISVAAIILFVPLVLSIFSRKRDELERLIPEPLIVKLWRHRIRVYLHHSIALSLAVWFGLVPLVIHHFHILTPIAILANIIILPVVFILLIVGLVSLPFWALGVFAPLVDPLVPINASIIWVIERLVTWGNQIPGAYLYLPDIPVWWLYCYYFIFLIILVASSLETILRIRIRLRYLYAGSAVLVIVFFVWLGAVFGKIPFIKQGVKEPILTMFDVRHGACFLVQFPDGSNLLYDAGSRGFPEVGTWTIAPGLWQAGITHLDTVILSHTDLDHINGLPSLLARFSIGRVIVSDHFGRDRLGRIMLDLIRSYKIPIEKLSRGDELVVGGEYKLKVLGPPGFEELERAFKDNDLSLVVKITVGNNAILLCGDIEKTGMAWLLESVQKELSAAIMQVPHHASMTSLEHLQNLVNLVKPSYALLNAQANTPEEEILNIYLDKRINVFKSYESGAIDIRLETDSIKAVSFK